MTYDCTEDVKLHVWMVKHYLDILVLKLAYLAKDHDASKLQEPEKAIFDQFTPCLKEVEFGSPEYKQALAAMGEGLKHHYANNRHHPEHFDNGVNGMTVVDLVEMICDWSAAAFSKGQDVNLDYLAERFNLSPQLKDIIVNTLEIFSERG